MFNPEIPKIRPILILGSSQLICYFDNSIVFHCFKVPCIYSTFDSLIIIT